MPDTRILCFARTIRCATVGSGSSSARAISGTVRPPTSRSVSGTCASSASAGWQQAKTRPSRSSGIIASSSPGRSRTASSSSRASSACLSRSDASRRSRSIARRLAVVRIHAAGVDGTPSRGQRSSATAYASCTASSARSTSPPSAPARIATARPNSARNVRATASAAGLRPEPVSPARTPGSDAARPCRRWPPGTCAPTRSPCRGSRRRAGRSRRAARGSRRTGRR